MKVLPKVGTLQTEVLQRIEKIASFEQIQQMFDLHPEKMLCRFAGLLKGQRPVAPVNLLKADMALYFNQRISMFERFSATGSVSLSGKPDWYTRTPRIQVIASYFFTDEAEFARALIEKCRGEEINFFHFTYYLKQVLPTVIDWVVDETKRLVDEPKPTEKKLNLP